MFFGRELSPHTAPSPQWQTGPVLIGPTPAELRMKALDSVAHMRDRGATTEEVLAEAWKVYAWLMGEKAE